MTSSPSLEAPGRRAGTTLALMALALMALAAWPLAVRAQPSRTAESIWSQEDASQRALQLVPSGARVDSTACQEIGVGSMGGLPRYRCTVRFSPGAASPDTASPASASP